jgi:hypothetical protein
VAALKDGPERKSPLEGGSKTRRHTALLLRRDLLQDLGQGVAHPLVVLVLEQVLQRLDHHRGDETHAEEDCC